MNSLAFMKKIQITAHTFVYVNYIYDNHDNIKFMTIINMILNPRK